MSGSEQYTNSKKPAIVLFSRHFPPHVSGGARRPYYLTQALQSLGCRVFVVAPALPDDTEGVVVPHIQPDPTVSISAKGGANVRDFLRNWLLWPDPDIRWTKRAVKVALAALPFRPDWVITTSPPESIHHAGLRLKTELGCHWYADMRDHWLVRPFRKQRESVLRKFIEQRIASNMLSQADLISTVNNAIAEEFYQYAGSHEKVFVLPHFSITTQPEEVTLPSDRLNLVYTGSFSLSDPDCDIADTLQVFAAALQQNPALHLHIVGRLTRAEKKRVLACSCAHKITLHGVVSLQQSHALQNAAQALVLAGSAHAPTPPGKAAEYAIRGKPIIAVTEAKWAKLYNGEKTATEHMAALGVETRAIIVESLFSQDEAAKSVLRKMAEFHDAR
ncbi:MAG: glycosyltransferase [Robiginitomaculum sp.]|nr:glycosyltransferase [Robiginitomaculum sp.]MDQ7076450.1 glycosyltransferase [Robiginitomaculum sp.]